MGFDLRKLTYHDPCFIGRWNDIYDEPRRVLNVINSNGVTEMRRNRNRSFCCGGGGGRVWMEEKIGKRINNTRVQEALDTGAEAMAAACPFCITMFEDGIKARRGAGSLRRRRYRGDSGARARCAARRGWGDTSPAGQRRTLNLTLKASAARRKQEPLPWQAESTRERFSV